MKNLILFENYFPEERRKRRKWYYENQPSNKIEKLRRRIDSLSPQTSWLYGGSSWMQSVADDPEGGLVRLISGAAQAVLGLGQAIADKFGDSTIKSKNKEDLEKNKKITLEKWGEKIEKSGKNKSSDFEIFYKDSIARGKKIFGKDFDIRNPKTDDEKIYVEYIEDAIKYYKD